MGVSVLILTHNEEHRVEECIKSCSFADEIIVVDDNSTDETVQIATKLGGRVVSRALQGDFGAQRQFAIEQATQDWIFFIDADERCTKELGEEIECIVKGEANQSYEVTRKNIFRYYKATHGSLRPDSVLRLMPKDGAKVEGEVHESFISKYPSKKLKGYLEHYTYDSIDECISKMNTYAKISVDKYMEQGKKPKFVRDVVLRPIWSLFKMYILERGFMDGKIGFVLAINYYNYTFQKYARFYYQYKTGGKF